MTNEQIDEHNRLQIESCLLDCITDCLRAGKILDGKRKLCRFCIFKKQKIHKAFIIYD